MDVLSWSGRFVHRGRYRTRPAKDGLPYYPGGLCDGFTHQQSKGDLRSTRHASKRHPYGARRPSDRIKGLGAARPGDLPRNLAAFGVLQHAAEQLPDHTALIHGRWSCDYAQLECRCDSIRRDIGRVWVSVRETASGSCYRTFPSTSLR